MKPENARPARRRDFPNDRMLPSSLLSSKENSAQLFSGVIVWPEKHLAAQVCGSRTHFDTPEPLAVIFGQIATYAALGASPMNSAEPTTPSNLLDELTASVLELRAALDAGARRNQH
jgi:hypothetical protein